jgi:hypothetical protein
MTLLLVFLAFLATAPDKICVFVALPERDGFVDAGQGLTDSRRDLIKEINSRTTLMAVAKRQDADIVVTIIRREVTSERDGGSVTVPIGPTTIVRPTYDSEARLVTAMEAGDFKRDVVGRFGWRSDVWQECAERVSVEVASWAEANRDRLLARRQRTLK